MELRLSSNSGFAIRKLMLVRWASDSSLAFGGCDAVWKPRSEGLPHSKGAQALLPVPLKGEDRSKRAGPANTSGTRPRRMPRLQRREPERDCPAAQIASVVLVVFLTFDF